MTVDTVPTADLLKSLTEALESAATAFPVDEQNFFPPSDGISLLDIKNDLLLSYLQNLVFLILLRLRNSQVESVAINTALNDEVIRKLIELRVYIDRGVRPLEGRLRYQIDKVLRAAEETERAAALKTKSSKKISSKKRVNGTKSHDANNSDVSNSASGSDNSESDSEAEDEDFEETLHRPNALALAKQIQNTNGKPQQARGPSSSSARDRTANGTATTSTGTYKPPRITPTSMPVPETARDRSDERARRRKSNLLNEYIDEEMSSAPKAQPSIGSNNTILDHGRSGLSLREREKERERTAYEETNFVRLPGESRADKRKARLRGDNNKRDIFGGEDWTGLGGLGDRVHRSVAQGKGRSSVLERREKRGRDTLDSQRGDGFGIGEKFTKRQKILEDRADRKRRKRD